MEFKKPLVRASSEAQKVFSLGHIYFSHDKHVSVQIHIHLFYAKSKSDKTRELSGLKLKLQNKGSIGCCMTFPDFSYSS